MTAATEDYKLRARTVEPVFGQLKSCQELTTMSRRGLTACESEWLLACTAHNLRKLHRHRAEGGWVTRGKGSPGRVEGSGGRVCVPGVTGAGGGGAGTVPVVW